jgi:hypothetical protein
MKDEFDFNPEDLEFEEFDIETEDDRFADFEELELSEVSTRTAVLSKNNMIALLCVKTAEQGGAICRVDPREERPAVQLYDDPAKALEWFTKSLRTSKKNGWQVVYDGLPLKG